MAIIDYNSALQASKDHGYTQLKVNKKDRGHLLSFRHETKCGGVRINVYFTTGTVATCLDHPHQGKTQLFRRNMTLVDLKAIFVDPRTHTDRGYHRIASSGAIVDRGIRGIVKPKVEYFFKDEGAMDFFSKVSKENIDSISLGPNSSFVILYTDGETVMRGVPKELHNKLNMKGRHSLLPKPEIIELGLSEETYFIQFADGKTQWSNLPVGLENAIKENNGVVDLITIGAYDQYYVQFKDGKERFNLDHDLYNLLKKRNVLRSRKVRGRGHPNLAEVMKISLSDNSEWIVGFTDGSCVPSRQTVGKILDSHGTYVFDFQMSSYPEGVLLYDE